jgi:predicted helicase
MVYRLGSVFPTPTHANYGVYLPNPGSMAPPFMTLMTANIIDNGATGSSGANYFPRWTYEAISDDGAMLAAEGEIIDGYRRIDNITDQALKRFQAVYSGDEITKDDLFHYVYGILHSPAYRETYAADLRKMLPRIPMVRDFRGFTDAGTRLAHLHLGYESVEPFSLEGLDAEGGGETFTFFAVGTKKMAFGVPTTEHKVAGERYDRSVIHYNDRITLRGIPEDAYRYMLGSRSAIEWIIDRYYVRSDKDSGIVNDPNDWSREVGDPRYILNLLARVVTVSVETMKIVDALPPLEVIAPNA